MRHEVGIVYQTRETGFHQDIQTPRRELKIRRAAEYFCRIWRSGLPKWNDDHPYGQSEVGFNFDYFQIVQACM